MRWLVGLVCDGKTSEVPSWTCCKDGNVKTPEVEIWSGPGPPVVKWRSCLLLNDSIQSLDDNAFLMKNIHLAHNIYFYDDIYLNVKNCKHRFFRFNKTLRIEKKMKGFHWPQDCSFPVPRYSQKKTCSFFFKMPCFFEWFIKLAPALQSSCWGKVYFRPKILPNTS